MKKSLLVAALTSVGAVVADKVDLETNLKIGFVDTLKVMRECEDGKKAAQDLEAKRVQLSKEIQAEEQKIADAMKDYNSKKSTLNEAAIRETEEKLVKMRRSYETKVQQSDDDLKMSVQRETERLQNNIFAELQNFGKEADYDALIDTTSGSVVWRKETVDVTSDVMKRVNGKKAKQAKPAQQLAKAEPTKAAPAAKATKAA